MVVTSLLATGSAKVVLLQRWRSRLRFAPARGRTWLVATTVDLDDPSLKVHRPI
jgi:hypothetical protein